MCVVPRRLHGVTHVHGVVLGAMLSIVHCAVLSATPSAATCVYVCVRGAVHFGAYACILHHSVLNDSVQNGLRGVELRLDSQALSLVRSRS